MGSKSGVGTLYAPFISAIKNNIGSKLDYLILLGDIMDFAVSDYQDAYEAGKQFFIQLKKDDITQEIIYVPGNHDFDLWHTVEYEVNVINKIKWRKPVDMFRHSVPAILDDRTGSKTQGLTLRNVAVNEDRAKPKYAGLFLDQITKPDTGQETRFNFAYPNVYFISDQESVLLTHGQYLESPWPITGEWALRIFSGDLKIQDPSQLNLVELVGINSPVSQLTSSGSGQAGPLTERLQAIEHMVYDHETKRLEEYIGRAVRIIILGSDLLFNVAQLLFNVKKVILNKIAPAQKAQYNEEFTQKEDVRKRFLNYYLSSMLEIADIKKDETPIDIPIPTKIIFGHTHVPISWGFMGKPNDRPLMAPNVDPIYLYNCGGWLEAIVNEKPVFKGAEIFFYETGKGISSVRVN